MKPIYHFIIAVLAILFVVFFCDISQYFGWQFCQDVSHTINYNPDEPSTDVSN